ncbi:hypothetical protein DV737_g2303, partial [Chaetothyriales sp. CBS 132003]
MHLLSLSALALAASTASAYLDTSPFFMFSTSELLNGATKISTAAAITSEISLSLSRCPSDYYILVSQPGVTADDYRSRRASSSLSQRLAAKPDSSNNSKNKIGSSLSIPEVIGAINIESLAKQLAQSCHVPQLDIDATAGSIPASYDLVRSVVTVQLAAPSDSRRQHDLGQNDALLGSLLDMIPTHNYTLVYTTSPQTAVDEGREYAMDSSDIQESLHLDLKRAETLVDGPLFHRYQFFTPGIFMGFLVGFLLLLILYVAIYGLASLQVTYAAFDKEQGQLAPKKLQ